MTNQEAITNAQTETNIDEELNQLLAPVPDEEFNPTINDETKRNTFKQLHRLLTLNRNYTAKVEEQLKSYKELLESDQSVTKEIEINNIVISIKFKSGVPVIPVTEAFAINLAVTKLVERLIGFPDGKAASELDSTPLDLANLRSVISNNSNLEYNLDS